MATAFLYTPFALQGQLSANASYPECLMNGSHTAWGWRQASEHPSEAKHLWEGSYNTEDLNRILLTKVNHTGSDVRIASGDILNPKAFPRQGVEASWWVWRPVFSVRWKHEEHINPLELRAILLSMVHHIRRRSMSRTRTCP